MAEVHDGRDEEDDTSGDDDDADDKGILLVDEKGAGDAGGSVEVEVALERLRQVIDVALVCRRFRLSAARGTRKDEAVVVVVVITSFSLSTLTHSM